MVGRYWSGVQKVLSVSSHFESLCNVIYMTNVYVKFEYNDKSLPTKNNSEQRQSVIKYVWHIITLLLK